MSHLISIPPKFKTALFEFFDYDIEKTFLCTKEDLKDFHNQFPNISIPRNFFDVKSKIDIDLIYENTIKEKINFITYEDEKYPKLLKEISDYPLLLYYKGDFDICNFDKTLAIVGSRRATEGAKVALTNIISQIKNADLTIVSGLAMGIDAVAHRCAIQNNLTTIGVIASGLDITYPVINKDIYQKIENGCGLILSEFPYKTPPVPQNFPQRNRIVTGLSKGTLVAEAGLRSGALISANLTLEQNRELMCIPGLISNPNTQGIYKLIKQGAPIVTSADDIFEILGWEFKKEEPKISISDDEKIIFDIISLEPVSFEKIQLNAVNFDISKLMITLTNLELKGLIKQINGRYYLVG